VNGESLLYPAFGGMNYDPPQAAPYFFTIHYSLFVLLITLCGIRICASALIFRQTRRQGDAVSVIQRAAANEV
jgi:hypothetical protein